MGAGVTQSYFPNLAIDQMFVILIKMNLAQVSLFIAHRVTPGRITLLIAFRASVVVFFAAVKTQASVKTK